MVKSLPIARYSEASITFLQLSVQHHFSPPSFKLIQFDLIPDAPARCIAQFIFHSAHKRKLPSHSLGKIQDDIFLTPSRGLSIAPDSSTRSEGSPAERDNHQLGSKQVIIFPGWMSPANEPRLRGSLGTVRMGGMMRTRS